jgi:branched chain amino acid efflux pump
VSAVWTAVVALAAATFAIRASAPLALGGRKVPERLRRALEVLPAAILAALVVTQALVGPGTTLHLDARVAGVAIAAVATWRGASIVIAVCLAALATALLRLA